MKGNLNTEIYWMIVLMVKCMEIFQVYNNRINCSCIGLTILELGPVLNV